MSQAHDFAELYRTTDGQWYWRIRAGNGEIIMQGEGYRHRADAEHLLRSRFGDDFPILNLDEESP